MKRGIKVSCKSKDNRSHVAFCSECFYQLEWADHYCHQCGCLLDIHPYGGDFDYVVKRRKEFQEDTKNPWEDKDTQ